MFSKDDTNPNPDPNRPSRRVTLPKSTLRTPKITGETTRTPILNGCQQLFIYQFNNFDIYQSEYNIESSLNMLPSY